MRKHGELFDSSSDDNDQGAIVDTDNKDDNKDDDVDDDDGVGYRRQTRGCRFVPRSQLSRSHNPFQPALYHSAYTVPATQHKHSAVCYSEVW